MHLRLIRHATLRLEVGGRHLLVDPMLDPAGARPPVEGTGSDRRNPLVELPEPAEVVVAGLDAVLVTRLRSDHFDATAAELLPEDVPVLCVPEDAGALRARGFSDVRPVEGAVDWAGIRVERPTPAPGFVLREASGRTLYLAGDTALDAAVEAVLDRHRPDVVVVCAGGARRAGGDRVVMDADDVVAVARRVAGARVVAVHLDAQDDCVQTRADLHQRLHEEELTEHVTVPEDGAAVPVE